MRFICSILMIILIVSCNSNPPPIASTDSAYKTVLPSTPVTNAEDYVGTLPCADCEGIDVSLQLKHDSSYIMNYVYKGSKIDSSNDHYAENGMWSLPSPDTLYLTSNDHTIKYIKAATTLTQLDGEGKLITGNNASMYVLHKK